MKNGKDQFVRVDQHMVVESCQLAKELNARLFSHVNSRGADVNSMFFYLKVKGRTIEQLKQIKMGQSIFKPSFISHRRNDDRLIEKVIDVLPFVSKIRASLLGQRILHNAEMKLSNGLTTSVDIYEHKDILIKK